ncbi:MAG TPA: hypothetical protein VFP27_06360, partial [Mycobacterium sp.]|nr:hypothetical protein [Mycobacterium sp.]
SPARGLLGEIDTEVTTSLADVRRLVEALRPPALDELGLLGAVQSRAAARSSRRTGTDAGGHSSQGGAGGPRGPAGVPGSWAAERHRH